MPTQTPNYNFDLPVVGGDENTWGSYLNGNWSKLDAELQALDEKTVFLDGTKAMTGPLTIQYDNQQIVFNHSNQAHDGTLHFRSDGVFEFRTAADTQANQGSLRIDNSGTAMTSAQSVVTQEKGDFRYATLNGDNAFIGDLSIEGDLTITKDGSAAALYSKGTSPWLAEHWRDGDGWIDFKSADGVNTKLRIGWDDSNLAMRLRSYVDGSADTVAITLYAGQDDAWITGTGTDSPDANSIMTRERADARYGGVAGKTWAIVSRNQDTNYQNTTGEPLHVSVTIGGRAAHLRVGATTGSYVTVSGAESTQAEDGYSRATLYAVVPPGHYYRVQGGWDDRYFSWAELR